MLPIITSLTIPPRVPVITPKIMEPMYPTPQDRAMFIPITLKTPRPSASIQTRRLYFFFTWLWKRKTTNAQREAQQYAQSIYTIMQHLWPKSCDLLEEHVFGGRHFCKSEVAWIKNLLSREGSKEFLASLGNYSERRLSKFLAKLE